uniref:Uncharacterized protein n=1 Tax=viral metagenome TaxID=1070528 RepID=A0A6C0BM66_9ZZZZ
MYSTKQLMSRLYGFITWINSCHQQSEIDLITYQQSSNVMRTNIITSVAYNPRGTDVINYYYILHLILDVL